MPRVSKTKPTSKKTAKKTAKKTTKKTATTAGKKAAPKKKTVAKRSNKAKPQAVPAELRQQMIEEAAYLKAEARGFTGGDAHADWLAAEAEIDARLSEHA